MAFEASEGVIVTVFTKPMLKSSSSSTKERDQQKAKQVLVEKFWGKVHPAHKEIYYDCIKQAWLDKFGIKNKAPDKRRT